jgi:hypothetical protein
MPHNSYRHFWLPSGITLLLITLLLLRVRPHELLEAAREIAFVPLLLATGMLVVALYLWDSVCLQTVYGIHENRWSYGRSLQLRGLSYLGGCVNYELGQAALAWGLAKLQNASLVRMLSRSVLLAYHDIFVLLTGACLGSLLTSDPRVERVRPYLAIAIAIIAAIAALFRVLPRRLRARFRSSDGESYLEGWSLTRSLRLILMRFGYFGILLIYAVTALHICDVPVDRRVTASTMPLVLLADGLPSFAGLGTRETSMQLLLDPGRERAPMLLAMSLFWSTGLLTGRLAIALAILWIRPIEFEPTDVKNDEDVMRVSASNDE